MTRLLHTFLQGIITFSINVRKNRAWYGSLGQVVLEHLHDSVGDNWVFVTILSNSNIDEAASGML